MSRHEELRERARSLLENVKRETSKEKSPGTETTSSVQVNIYLKY